MNDDQHKTKTQLIDELEQTCSRVAELEQVEEALRESEEKYRTIFENVSDSITYVNKFGTIIHANDKEEIFGRKPEEIIGKNFTKLGYFDVKDIPKYLKLFKDVIKGKKTLDVMELEIKHKDGHKIPVEVSTSLVKKNGRIEGFLCIVKDITERKRAEDTLKDSEERFRAVVQSAKDSIILIDNEGIIHAWNEAADVLFQHNESDVIGKELYQIIVPERYHKSFKSGFEHFKTTGKGAAIGKTLELTALRKDGVEFPIEMSLSAIKLREQWHAIGIIRDITERKRTEEALKQKTEQQEVLLSSIPAFVYYKDTESKLIAANKAFSEMVNTPIDQLAGKTAYDLFPKEQAEVFHIGDRKVIKSGKPIMNIEEEYTAADGKTRWASTSKVPYFYEEGKVGGMVGITLDITERKRAEEALEESERRYRQIIEEANDTVYTTDPNGYFIYINPPIQELTGYSPDELIGMHFTELIPEQWRNRVQQFYVRQFEDRVRNTTKEFPILTRAGEERWIEQKVTLLTDGDRVTGFQSIVRDITDRKRAEADLEATQEQLRNLSTHLQSAREEDRSMIAREIHDELGQALTTLKFGIVELKNTLPADQISLVEKANSMAEYVDTIAQTVNRIATQLRPILLDELGLVDAIEWEVEQFENRTGINCKFTVETEEMVVDQDRSTAIYRIVQEALTNIARHAQATRNAVTLKMSGGKLHLSITDNGIGIAEDQVLNPKSLGIIGMRERVLSVGGNFEINGIKKRGTKIMVIIPVENESEVDAENSYCR